MDRIINVSVVGNVVEKDSKNAGTKGEAEVTALHITFSDEWMTFSKIITFRNAKGEDATTKLLFKSVSDVVNDNSVFIVGIPEEALTEEGWCSFTIEGYALEEDGDMKVAISATDTLYVKPNDTDYVAATPTPSEARQLRIEVAKSVEETGEIVKEAKEDFDEAVGAMAHWDKWDVNTSYAPLNKVQNRGASYICIKENKGIEPFFDVVDGVGQFWVLIADKGERGEQGLQGEKGDSGTNGVSVPTHGMVAFNVNDKGHLVMSYYGDERPDYFIDTDGHLKLRIEV